MKCYRNVVHPPRIVLAVTLIGGMLLSSGAGAQVGGAAPAAQPAPSFDQAAFDLLPDGIKQSKQFRNEIDAPVVPWVRVDASGKLTGPVPDMTDAIGKVLGVSFVTKPSTQANTMLDLSSGRADLSFGSMGDTPALEKSGPFLVYLLNPRAFLVKQGNPHQFTDLSSMCGLSVGLQGTSSSQAIIVAASKQYCESQGKSSITVKSFPSLAGIALAVQSGQVDSLLLPLPQVKDIAASAPSRFEIVLDQLPNGMPPLAAGLFFGPNRALLPAFQKAFADIIQSGVYLAILKKYGLEGSAVKQTVVNLATTEPKLMEADPPLKDLK